MLTVQDKSESSTQNGEENRSFGVLTITSSTSIDNYFATKLAKLRSKAEKNKSASEIASAVATDIASTDKHKEQSKQQLTPPASSGTGPATECNMLTVKQRKKKRKKVDDCHTIDKRLHFRSLNASGTSKKKKRHIDDLSEVTVECNSNSQNVKTCRRTKGRPRTNATTLLNHSEHTSFKSKVKKLTHDYHKR